MSQNRNQPLDYTQKYQIRSGRVNFADYAIKKQMIQDGRLIGLNIYPPDNDASIIPIIKEGQANTTPEELNRYLGINGDSNTNIIILEAPVITNIVGSNQSLIVFFTQIFAGLTITNYSYSTDGGLTFSSLSVPATTSPILINTLSSDGITPLTNGVSYSIVIKALTASITSPASNSFSGTPDLTIVSFTNIGSDTWIAPLGISSVEYLVVGGGGGGGNGFDTGGGGGGGGGMVLSGTLSVIPGTNYIIEVGSGGNGGGATRTNIDGESGDSSIFSSVTALGGGFGKGSRSAPGGGGLGGAAQITNLSSPVGGNGGGNFGTSVGGCGGGGGGAGGAGSNGVGSPNNPISGGAGGAGVSSSLSGMSVIYGGGGAGARGNTLVTGTMGGANTGKGGGGGSAGSSAAGAGGNGGSGIVILKY